MGKHTDETNDAVGASRCARCAGTANTGLTGPRAGHCASGTEQVLVRSCIDRTVISSGATYCSLNGCRHSWSGQTQLRALWQVITMDSSIKTQMATMQRHKKWNNRKGHLQMVEFGSKQFVEYYNVLKWL